MNQSTGLTWRRAGQEVEHVDKYVVVVSRVAPLPTVGHRLSGSSCARGKTGASYKTRGVEVGAPRTVPSESVSGFYEHMQTRAPLVRQREHSAGAVPFGVSSQRSKGLRRSSNFHQFHMSSEPYYFSLFTAPLFFRWISTGAHIGSRETWTLAQKGETKGEGRRGARSFFLSLLLRARAGAIRAASGRAVHSGARYLCVGKKEEAVNSLYYLFFITRSIWLM